MHFCGCLQLDILFLNDKKESIASDRLYNEHIQTTTKMRYLSTYYLSRIIYHALIAYL